MVAKRNREIALGSTSLRNIELNVPIPNMSVCKANHDVINVAILHAEDGLGVKLTDSILEDGFEMTLWRKNHLEACYCLDGWGTVKELNRETVDHIRPGALYAINNHDRHRIRVTGRVRLICTFVPAYSEHETRDNRGISL